MAFDIDDSGQYTDLPNRNLTPRLGFSSIVNNGSSCTLTMNAPAGVSYPAGTKIRMHYPGSSYNYVAASSVVVPNEWTEYSGQVQGVNLHGINSSRFRHGTQFVRVLILANYHQAGDSILEIDDLKLEVIQE